MYFQNIFIILLLNWNNSPVTKIYGDPSISNCTTWLQRKNILPIIAIFLNNTFIKQKENVYTTSYSWQMVSWLMSGRELCYG